MGKYNSSSTVNRQPSTVNRQPLTVNLQSPTVSIVIPTYNRADLIGNALESAIAQSYENLLEIIVVDDASTDNTEDVVNLWKKKDQRIKYIKNSQNLNCLGARIVGFKAASGEWLVNLDSDDVLTPDSIGLRMKVVGRSRIEKLGVVWGSIKIYGNNDEWTLCRFADFREDFYRNNLKSLSCCCALSMMVKKECFEVSGYPDPTMYWEDSETTLFLFSHGYGGDFCNDVVAEIRESARTSMQNNAKMLAEGFGALFRKYKGDVLRVAGGKYVRLNYLRLIYYLALADEWEKAHHASREAFAWHFPIDLILDLCHRNGFFREKALKFLDKYYIFMSGDRTIGPVLMKKLFGKKVIPRHDTL